MTPPPLPQCFNLVYIIPILWIWYCMGSLIRVEQRMIAQLFLSIIADHVYPVMLMMYPAGKGYVLQDNTLCHEADIVHRCFEEHDRDIIFLSWSVHSPDPNRIENLWDGVERGIIQLDLISSNIKELESSVLIYGFIFFMPPTNVSSNPCTIKGTSLSKIVFKEC